MRVFLDANILFSAAKSSAAVRELLNQLISSGHTLVADGYVIGEARRNLERKFPATIPDLETLIDELEANLGVNTTLDVDLAPGLPEKDRPVLAASLHHGCQVLLTGDRTHFGPFYGQAIKGVEVHSPSSLAIKIGRPPVRKKSEPVAPNLMPCQKKKEQGKRADKSS